MTKLAIGFDHAIREDEKRRKPKPQQGYSGGVGEPLGGNGSSGIPEANAVTAR